MQGTIRKWDAERSVGIFRPDRVGQDGDLIVTTAQFIESGLAQPYDGDRFTFEVRVSPSGQIEPCNFIIIGDLSFDDGGADTPAVRVCGAPVPPAANLKG